MTKANFGYFTKEFSLDLMSSGEAYRVIYEDKAFGVEILRADRQAEYMELLIDKRRVVARVSTDGAKNWVTIAGRTWLLTRSAGPGAAGHAGHAGGEILSPMPGQVRAVNVTEGEAVMKGQTLLVVEAMKMEIRVVAPRNGVVKSLKVKQGQTVEREQLLVEIVETPG